MSGKRLGRGDRRMPPRRRISTLLIMLAVIALPLQPGMLGARPALNLAERPAGAAVILQDHEHAGNECQTGDCPQQQCDIGAGITCHCFCTQFPLQTVGELTFVAIATAMAVVEDSPGPAPRRLDRPFRPSA